MITKVQLKEVRNSPNGDWFVVIAIDEDGKIDHTHFRDFRDADICYDRKVELIGKEYSEKVLRESGGVLNPVSKTK